MQHKEPVKMSFFGRVLSYVFNEVLVNTLANRCGSQLRMHHACV